VPQRTASSSRHGDPCRCRAAHQGSKREGLFYVEARTEKAVTEAVDGLRGVLRSRPMVRVPHAEMTDAIAVREAAGPGALAPGAWARVTGGGVYRGDLTRVVANDGGGLVTVHLVPRIDYAAMAQRCARLRARLLSSSKVADACLDRLHCACFRAWSLLRPQA
jgi:hypothetical protein